MENQLRNSQNIDVHQGRWDPKIISVALGLYLKSPSAYEMLKKTNMLVLLSKRLLQYYKNSVKQPVGISADNLQWMKMECSRQSVPDFGKHGGLIIDEMAIQDDLVIERAGDAWKLVGMVDMGETNNNISVICKKDKRVEWLPMHYSLSSMALLGLGESQIKYTCIKDVKINVKLIKFLPY